MHRDPIMKAPLVMPALLQELLPEYAQARVREAGYNRVVRKGDVLQEAGHVADEAMFFQSGWYAFNVAGVVVSLYGPGDAFMTTLDRNPIRSPGAVRALSRGSVSAVPVAVLREILLGEPEIGLFMANQALSVLLHSRVLYARRNQDPLEVRLAYVLWTLSEPCEDGRRKIIAELPQAELASYLGVPREEISRKRKMLVQTGYLFEQDGESFMDSATPMLLESSGFELTSDTWSRGSL